jgi:hypothetical protein
MATQPADETGLAGNRARSDLFLLPNGAHSSFGLQALLPDGNCAIPAPHKRRASPQSDEVARARAKRARERASVELHIERRLVALEHEENFVVPRLHVVITGSLGPASALKLIELWSERSFSERGTPWVFMTLDTWVNYTGLAEEDWLSARQVLRDKGLIQERRRFNHEANELFTEIAFMSEVFSCEVARVREEMRDQAWATLRSEATL